MPSDTEQEAASEGRLRDLQATLVFGCPSHALIDPLVGEPIPVDSTASVSPQDLARARALAWGRDIAPVDLHPSIDLAARFHPYLVALEGPDDPWLARTLDMAEAERTKSQAQGVAGKGVAVMRIGGWLRSSASRPQLAAELGEHLRVPSTSLGPQRYQRLVDRRALAWARCVAGEARMGAALDCVQQWTYLDATGRVTWLRRQGESAEPLQWFDKDWARFMEGEQVHQTLARYLGELSRRGLGDPAPEGELLVRSHTALQKAAAASARWPGLFKTVSDDTAWAALLLLHGDAAMSAPGARALQDAMASQPGATLHDLAAVVNDSLFEMRK